jgi:hypothetical protein
MRRSRLFYLVVPMLAWLPGTVAEAPFVSAAPRPEAAVAVQPVRVLDTRSGIGAAAGYLTPFVPLPVAVPTAVAGGASSVILNITATEATLSGWVKAWPCNEAPPAASALNYTPGRTSANAVLVKLGPGGVCLSTNVAVHLIADVSGWTTGDQDLNAISPNRLLDTRTTNTPLLAGTEMRLAIAGTAGIGANASMAALNLTVDKPGRPGWVVAYPCGQQTDASTVNFAAGETVANLTLVALSAGHVCIRSYVDTHLIVDSFGWATGAGQIQVQSPSRILDTRAPGMWPSGAHQSQSTIQLNVAGRGGIPTDAAAALLTVTIADAAGEGFVTAWPCDQARPTASTINTWPSALRSNLSYVKLAADGTACFLYEASNATPTSLIVDAVGWTTGGPARPAPVGVGRVILGGSASCVFGTASQPVTVAFCDTFDEAEGNPATRSGDLDATIWGVSRTTTQISFGSNMYNEWLPATLLGCGAAQTVLPPNDVRICDGRLHSAVSDGGGQPILAMYPKQPFDIAGRTGTAVFDVSADAAGPHSAWPEFWWTDQPIPAPGALVPAQEPYARNSIGFLLASDGCGSGRTSVYKFLMTRNYEFSEIPTTPVGCVTKGSATGALNHFEVKISETRIEVYGSDAGSSAVRLLAYANVAVPLTRGVIWIENAHYNACKAVLPIKQCDHTFTWDNVGFDGPALYRDLTFDVQDALVPRGNGRVNLGYLLDATGSLNVDGVYWEHTPSQAYVGFNFWNNSAAIPTVRVNGGPWHTMAWPFDGAASWRTIAIPIPLNELRPGTNTIEFQGAYEVVVSNINIILINAAPVN